MAIELLPDAQPDVPPQPFAAFADQLPSTAAELEGVPSAPPTANAADEFVDEAEVQKKRVKMSRKMKKMMDGLRDQIVDIPVLWFHQRAAEHPEWELDAKEREFLTDAFAVVFEVLDIDVRIEPLTWTLESVWWVISYPFVAFLFLFLTKRGKVGDATAKEEATEE